MKYQDYYATLGVARDATQDEIKQAFRKLARSTTPDVSKEADAEARFKDVNEANEVLKDPESRAAYDRMGSNWQAGQDFQPPPNWDQGFEFRGRPGSDSGAEGFDASDFFESLFGARAGRGPGTRRPADHHGEDHHAKVLIDIEDAYRGAERSITLRMPVAGADGHVALQERRLDVRIPKGIRPGQQLRLAGQGGAGSGGAAAGDLYLEIAFAEHPRFRVDGADVYVDLALAPWEAALGAAVEVATPDGALQLNVPAGSAAGRKLRLKGRGLPGKTPGDLYAVVAIVLPKADGDAARAAYAAFAQAFPGHAPRSHQQG